MELEQIRNLIHEDMAAVNETITRELASDVVLINQIGLYIVNSGGKRLRPALLLLCARALGYEGRAHIELAAVVEFIHTATLLHDDVVDDSSLRRGRETANELWGSEASVLVGDFLYSRAFQMMVKVDSMAVMAILADATNTISEGEVLQLLNCHDADTTEERYLDVIRYKTAKLFEASARLAAVLAGYGAEMEEAMGRYGMHLGTAFQLVDDVLDYSGATGEIGKNIGDDLAEGKPTLPLIHAMRRGTPEESDVIRRSIEEGGLEHIDAVRAAIDSTDALAYTARSAQDEAQRALAALDGVPESPFKEGLTALASFSVDRSY